MYELTDATMSYAEIAAAMENGSDVVFRVHDYMIDRKPYYDLVITQVEQDGTIVFTGQSPGCNLYVFVYPYRENIYISLSRNIAEMQFFQFTVNKSGDQYTVTPGVNVTWAEVERVIRTYNAAVARFVIPGSSPQRVIRAAFNEVITDNAVTARTLVDNNGSVEYWELVYYKSSGTAEMHVKTLTTT